MLFIVNVKTDVRSVSYIILPKGTLPDPPLFFFFFFFSLLFSIAPLLTKHYAPSVLAFLGVKLEKKRRFGFHEKAKRTERSGGDTCVQFPRYYFFAITLRRK